MQQEDQADILLSLLRDDAPVHAKELLVVALLKVLCGGYAVWWIFSLSLAI
jgi:hypothetical protein